MSNLQTTEKWSENIILADADYVDSVAFNLTVNFERMLERQIPKADLARWIDCVALDGGLRPGNHETLVALIHSAQHKEMSHFNPGRYDSELAGRAFSDHLGEFIISPHERETGDSGGDLLTEALEIVMTRPEVKRIMVIANGEDEAVMTRVRTILRRSNDEEKRITVFAMQPLAGGNFRQEILGYSLMAALGIEGREISER